MMTKIVIAGKFDPVHEGHIDHIVKASKLGGYLFIITHTDQVVAAHSTKGFCAVPLRARVSILEAIMRYHGIKGQVDVSDSPDGTCAEKLRLLGPDIFAKGGDRTVGRIPQNEVDVCEEIGCRIIYGVGDLLNSSSKLMADGLKYTPNWVLRKNNEQYEIYDCRIMDSVVSITYLKPHQSTSGHEHPHRELYLCLKGKGWLKVGERSEETGSGLASHIPPNTFHQMSNQTDETLVFLCIWKGENKS